jgi:hypothetical protein
MATTTNYGWSTPDNTAYVKDGALAIRTLGSAIDTTLASFLNIKQIVTASTSTLTTNSTTTFADTTLTATITPTSVNSKILVLVNQSGTQKTNGNANNAITLQLLRGATSIITFAANLHYTGTALSIYGSAATHILDSPATTSAITYKTQFRNFVAAASVAVQTDNATSTITLIELEY